MQIRINIKTEFFDKVKNINAILVALHSAYLHCFTFLNKEMTSQRF